MVRRSSGALAEALSALPERQRRALLLREWKQLSYAQIAEELGVPPAAVGPLLYRARQALAQRL